MIEFTVPGHAQPAGSKKAFPFQRPDGKGMGVRVVDANPAAGAWKERVAIVAASVRRAEPPLNGPVRLELTFTLLRPRGHFKKDGVSLKSSAPAFPTVKPDTTKLVRGVEDALTGIAWIDDAQVVKQYAEKVYGAIEQTLVRVIPLNGNGHPKTSGG